MKKICCILFIFFIVFLDITFAENETKQIEYASITDVPESDAQVFEFTEEEAGVIKGEIPKPSAMVTISKMATQLRADSFAPDIEKLLDELLFEDIKIKTEESE
ncbi:MAG: hypothetical protein H8E33_01245 [Candidatus Cloacimonetes bacterium]|nr:hypothetical protein [Candidatus Cloacimonadota bacterium]MBL7108057.1 hypothetical protein [Candidatus Cloacimonadota bacterium]